MAKKKEAQPKKQSFFQSVKNQVNPLNPNNFIYDKAGGFLNKATNIAPQAYAQAGARYIPGINSNKSILGLTTADLISNASGANLFANANKIAQAKGFGALKDLGYLGNVAGGVATVGSNLTPSVAGAAALKAAKAAKAAGGSFTNVAKTAAKTFVKQPKAAAAFVALNTPSMVVGNNNSPEAIAKRSLAKQALTPAKPKPPVTTTTTPKTELPKTSTVPPVKMVPLPGKMPPRPAPPKEYVPMPYAPSTPTPSTYVAPKPTVDTRMQTYDGPTDDAGNPIYGAKDENTSSSIMAKTGNTVSTAPTSTPTPFNRGTLPPDYQALAAQRDANQAALAEQTRLGLLGNADTLATSNLQTQGQFADVIGGRADSLYGMASTGNRRDFQLAQNATLAANQAGMNTLQTNYAEAMNQAQLNYQKQLLEEASKKAALAAQIRNIG